jgi:hypothetical protein
LVYNKRATFEIPEKRILDEGLAYCAEDTFPTQSAKDNKGDALEAAWCIIKSSATFVVSLEYGSRHYSDGKYSLSERQKDAHE